MTEKCFDCDKPATLVNYTQFAGTHYWCDEHVPPEDRDDCIPYIPGRVEQYNKHHENLQAFINALNWATQQSLDIEWLDAFLVDYVETTDILESITYANREWDL